VRATPFPRLIPAAPALGLAVFMLAALPDVAAAQAGTSALQGRIADEQGGVLPGVRVVLTHDGTGAERETVSGETGMYQFVAVPPGRYSLRAELTGFRTTLVEQVDLQVDATSRTDVVMSLGEIAETVHVTSELPILNTTDASIGHVIGGAQIRALPLEARNVVGLMSLQPGVTFVPKPTLDTVDPRFGSVSGARADQTTVTLDGIDVNDSQEQTAFTSVLRVTLDSVQEFRVSTSNYGADFGRSSGAQVSLVTRSGTNTFSGAGYYGNRDTRFSSNEYFLKLSQIRAGEESQPPKLDKNTFGFSLGGPVRRDRLFFFGNFEGLNEDREQVVTRGVPSMSFRDGVLLYRCDNPAACPGGSVQGLTSTHTVPAGRFGLGPAELRRIDPLGIGPSPAAMEYFRQYPGPNDDGTYPGNIEAFRFGAPIENTFRTYTGRGDYRITGSHSLFGRVVVQDDAQASAPQFPGGAPNTTTKTKNWGTAIGWDATLRSNLVNTFRYGYTLIDASRVGLRDRDLVSFRFIAPIEFAAAATSRGREVGTHNLANDLSWLKGRHTVKFGTNIRWIRNDRFDFQNSYLTGSANPSWTDGVGRLYRPGGPCPAPADCSGLPVVAAGGLAEYADSIIGILGAITQTDVNYNYMIDGRVIPAGDPLLRLYAADEYEFYVQDSWQPRNDLTITGGVRYSLYSPPYEARGQQVAPNVSLGGWFDERVRNMQQGIPSSASPRIGFVPAGPKNNGPGFYEWDRNNWGPRVAVAWTPTREWVVRSGYGLMYDRVGAGLATTFDSAGSFGLATSLSSVAGANNEDEPAIRFVDSSTVPQTFPAAPPATFPTEFPLGNNEITMSIDNTLTTPYSHAFNVAVGRDLGRNYAVEAAYVGRRGRNLLIRRDIAMPLNLTDPASGVDYFTAARQLIEAHQAAGGNPSAIGPIAYWENIFPGAAGGGLTATQVMAGRYGRFEPDYITALWAADQFCVPACSRFGPYAYFSEQYGALAAHSSIAQSEYDALQLMFRRRFSQGYQFDLNYTYGRGKDHASEVERGASFGNFGSGGTSGFLVNSFEPDRNYSYSDFDVRHQINLNWLSELPFGQGRRLGANAGRFTHALIGDWALAGIWRWSSGYPFNVLNGRSWATNWNITGNSELVDPGRLPSTGRNKDAVDGFPSPFADPQDALSYFRRSLPGERGIRNLLRGDGYFTIDASLSKGFRLPGSQRLQFRWDVFNITNTPRFDTGNVTTNPEAAGSFGRYDGSLAACDGAAGRCMQLNLRYDF
jgi:hypothetical protein